ncbi:MAG: OmpA family protein [Burkholderiales bacterium]|nr:OmpA family protein [Burkholderiales bacterium]
MNKSFSKKHIGLAAACALALGILSGAAQAQNMNLNPDGKAIVDDTGGTAVMNPFGLCWHSSFGPPPAAGPECDPNYVAPKPVAAIVPPAPQVVAAMTPPPAPKPVAEKLTLDADTLFDFDKATLRPAGRDTLDAFVGKLKDITPETIMTIGHADRIGTPTYNQRLSEQRVATVKDYMVSKGVEANRIYTEGKGESQPVTKAEDCVGPKSAKVIACLQPDRRVDIEVIGTRITH